MAQLGGTLYLYNNVIRNVNEGVNNWVACVTCYIFNNVWENDGHYPPDPNCLMISPPGSSNVAATVTAWVYNNTFDSTCSAQAQAGNANTPHWGLAVRLPSVTITFSIEPRFPGSLPATRRQSVAKPILGERFFRRLPRRTLRVILWKTIISQHPAAARPLEQATICRLLARCFQLTRLCAAGLATERSKALAKSPFFQRFR